MSQAAPFLNAPSADADQRSALGLRRIRLLMIRNTLVGKLASSRLRMTLVLIFSAVFWGGLFWLFYDGFRFLNHHRMISGPLVEMLFGLYFGSLLFMLLFSTGIILYAGLFASPESEYLLIRPVPTAQIFAFKFQEAMFFSCWGFLLLGSPMMIAYGIEAGAPWSFYPLALVFFIAYAFVPGSIGAMCCLLLTRFLPRRKKEILLTVAAVTVTLGAFYLLRGWYLARGTVLSQTWLSSLVEHLQVSNLPFLPSQWISKGLLYAAYTSGASESIFYLMVLVSNALFAYLLTAIAYRSLYRGAYNRVHSDSLSPKPRASNWLPAVVDRLFFAFPGQVRVLIVKDVRTFLRDPVQWLQVLIFSGLLAFYFFNLGRLNYYNAGPYWRNLLSFFNLAVTGLLLATYTSRFIFPLLSLEGQTIWVLGLCPISRASILWGKFAFAFGGAVLVTGALTLMSAIMLHLEPLFVCLHLATILILCSGVSGISVGLGARFPETKETDPSKIAAGFGGTLNLVVTLSFIIVIIGAMALPCHLYSVTQSLDAGMTAYELGPSSNVGIDLPTFRFWLVVSVISSLIIGVAATFVPMRIGSRAFQEMEF